MLQPWNSVLITFDMPADKDFEALSELECNSHIPATNICYLQSSDSTDYSFNSGYEFTSKSMLSQRRRHMRALYTTCLSAAQRMWDNKIDYGIVFCDAVCSAQSVKTALWSRSSCTSSDQPQSGFESKSLIDSQLKKSLKSRKTRRISRKPVHFSKMG